MWIQPDLVVNNPFLTSHPHVYSRFFCSSKLLALSMENSHDKSRLPPEISASPSSCSLISRHSAWQEDLLLTKAEHGRAMNGTKQPKTAH
jgi:hypothetical protein